MKKNSLILLAVLLAFSQAQAVRYGIKKQIYVSGAGAANPSYLCYSLTSDRMYSGNTGTNEVVAIDCAGDLLMGAVPNVYPGSMVYDQINNRIYLHDGGIDFFAINCIDNKLDTTLGYGQGGGPVDYNPLDNKIYHLDQTFNQIFAFNGTDYSVNIFSGYYNMLYYQPKNVLYTGQEYTDTMLAIDGSTNVTIAKIGVSGLASSGFFMAADTIGGRVYIAMPNWDIISVIDPSANVEDVRLGLPDKPADMAFCPINRKMFVACNGKSTYSLAVIDTLNKVDSIQVGDSVSTVVYNPNDSLIYIGCNTSGYVKLIDPRLPTPMVVDSLYLMFKPQFKDMSVDKGGDIYIAIYNSDNIFVIGQIPLRMWRSTMTNGYWFDYMAWQYSDDGGNSWGNFSTIYPNDPGDSTVIIQTGHTVQQTLGGPAVLVDQLIVDGALELVENSLTIADGPGDDIIVNGIFRRSGGTFIKNPGATMIFRQYSAYEHNIDGDAIPTAIWDTLSILNITGVMTTMPAGMNQAFGNITWNCFQQAVDAILPGGAAFAARDVYVSSTGANSLYLTSAAKPELTVNNLGIGSGTAILGGGGPRKLRVKGDFNIYDPGWLYLTDTLSRSIDTLFLYGDYSHLLAGIGGGGPDSTAIVFCGSDTQIYYDDNEVLTGYVNFQVNPGSFLKINEWNTLGNGSQGNFTLMPGATLIYTNMWGIYPAGQDTGVIRNLGARNYSQGANYHIYSMSTGPYRTGPGIPDTVNQLIIESYGDQVYLSKDVAVMDSLKLLANNLQINGHRLSLFGPIYQTSGNLWGDSLASLVIMGGNPAPVILPSWVRDLGLLNINRPAMVTMSDTMLIYNRLELVNGILNNGGNKLSFLDGASIFRNGSGGLAGAGPMVFVNQVGLEYGAGIITAGPEMPANSMAIMYLALQGINDTLIVNRDTLNIWNNLSLSGGIRFNGKMFSSYGLIDTVGPAGELIFTDSCQATIFGTIDSTRLPAITGGSLTLDNSAGFIMRRNIFCPGPINLSTGGMTVGPNILTLGDSLSGAGLLATDSTSALIFQGNAVNQTLSSSVNHLKSLSWNRPATLFVTNPLVLHDSLKLGQGSIDNSVNLSLRTGITIFRNSGILAMPPVFEGPIDVVYGSHGGGPMTAGNELPYNATDLNDLTLSIGLLSNDTIALAGSAQVNGRLSLQQGVLSVGANSLTLRDTINAVMGQLATDSTSTLQILNSPFLFTIPSSVKELDSLILNSPSGLELPDTVHIRSDYRQTSGKISFGQLIYGPAATLEYNKFGNDTSSNFEFPDIGGPHNLIAAATGGLQLHTNRTVPGTLTLNNTLYTGANTVYVDTLGNVVQGAGFVDGNLAKLIPWTADTIISYELGSAGTGPSPVNIEVFNNTVPTFVTVGIKGAGHPLTNDSTACLRKFWSFSGSGLAADASLITLNYLAADFNPPNFTEAAHESTMIAGRYDNGAPPGWQFPGIVTRNIYGTTDGGSIVLSHTGNFADNPEFTLARDSVAIANLAADTTLPYIASNLPADGATGVALTDSVSITFSEPVKKSGISYTFVPDPGTIDTVWSADSTSIIFNHSPFTGFTAYTVRVLGVQDTMGNVLTGRDSIGFITQAIDTTLPYIASSLPADGATGIGLTDSVRITFSEPVRKSLVSYTFVPNPGIVDTLWSADSTSIIFNHSVFTGLTSYTVRVLGVQDTMGNALAGRDSIGFATLDATAPIIVATSPTDGAVGVAINAPISVTFSEPIDTATFSYTFIPNPGGMSVVWTMDSTVATFVHNDLSSATSYTITVTAANDTAGNSLSGANSFGFTTADVIVPSIIAASPNDGAIEVAVNAIISATFSEPIDTATFAYNIIPNPGGLSVAWSADSTIVTFGHSDLLTDTIYLVSITNAADAAGNALGAGAVPNPWSFRTINTPTVVSSSWAGGAYKLFSVPVKPSVNPAIANLGDDLGAYNDSTWLMFNYNAMTDSFIPSPDIYNGYGYWLASASDATLDVQGIKQDSYSTVGLEAGWNLIGCPFLNPVLVQSIEVIDSLNQMRPYNDTTNNMYLNDSIIRQRMWNYADNSYDLVNNGAWDSLSPFDSASHLLPWQGYAVYALQSCSLFTMPAFKASVKGIQLVSAPKTEVTWQAEFSAFSGKAADRGIRIGISPQAKPGYDRLDAEKPPLVSNNITAYIPHNDWNHGPCQAYQYDFRPQADYIEWPLLVRTAEAERSAELAYSLSQQLSDGYQLYLVDRKTGQATVIRNTGKIGFSGSQEFAVIYTNQSLNDLSFKPLSFDLNRTYPNPFAHSITVNYQLSATGHVSLKVYNIAGQLVQTMVDETALPGYYSQVWNGCDNFGRKIASGIYIMRLVSGGQERTRKLVKIK